MDLSIEQQRQQQYERYYCNPTTLTSQNLNTLHKVFSSSYSDEDLTLKINAVPKLYKEPKILQPFHKWFDLVDFKISRNSPYSCVFVKNTQRRILPSVCHLKFVYRAHRGMFLGKKSIYDDKNRLAVHNNFVTTRQLLRTKFAVGLYEFGIPEELILYHVTSCIKCKANKTKTSKQQQQIVLPPFPSKKNIPAPSMASQTSSVDGDIDPSALNNPISQLLGTTQQGSAWYHKSGAFYAESAKTIFTNYFKLTCLSEMTDPYQKILGVIKEIGIDLRLAIDNQGNSNSLKTKIICAKLLIGEQIAKRSKTLKNQSSSIGGNGDGTSSSSSMAISINEAETMIINGIEVETTATNEIDVGANATNEIVVEAMATSESEVETFLKHCLEDGDFTTLSYDLKLLANDDAIFEDLELWKEFLRQFKKNKEEILSKRMEEKEKTHIFGGKRIDFDKPVFLTPQDLSGVHFSSPGL